MGSGPCVRSRSRLSSPPICRADGEAVRVLINLSTDMQLAQACELQTTSSAVGSVTCVLDPTPFVSLSVKPHALTGLEMNLRG